MILDEIAEKTSARVQEEKKKATFPRPHWLILNAAIPYVF